MTLTKGVRARLTYVNLTSTLALALVVGGGTAYAAGLAPGSVGTEQLQKGAVTGPKVRNGSLSVLCQPGEHVVGGGHDVISGPAFGGDANVIIKASRPSKDETGAVPQIGSSPTNWYVKAWRNDGSELELVGGLVMCGR
jgi:hypothetical protein